MSTAEDPILALLLEGESLRTAGELDKAIKLFKKSMELSPFTVEPYVQLAITLMANNQFEDVESLLSQAKRISPNAEQVFAVLANYHHRLGNYPQAVSCYQESLKRNPGSTSLRYNMASALQSSGELEQAIIHYQICLQATPESLDIATNLILAYKTASQPLEALITTISALQHHPANENFRRHFATLLPTLVTQANLDNHFINNVLQEAERTLSLNYINGQHLARPILALLLQKYSLHNTLDKICTPTINKALLTDKDIADLQPFLNDSVFLKILNNELLTEMRYEKLLTNIRRYFSTLWESDLSESSALFLASLSVQCHHNHYIYWLSEEEEEERSRLEKTVLSSINNENFSTRFALQFALLCCYQPPHNIPNYQRAVTFLQDREELQSLNSLINQHQREQQIKQGIHSFGIINSNTSIKVQQQYEEDPYPTWNSIETPPPGAIPAALSNNDLLFTNEKYISSPENILIAGCGTGKQPILTALLYPQADITAVDLSRTSLAYAIRMSEKYQIKNISFYHGDILNLHELGKCFEMINSSGVLHHMEEPKEGLKILTELLTENGVMMLSLYSTIGREIINNFRKNLKSHRIELPVSKQQLRSLRHDSQINNQEILNSLQLAEDFYSLNACRDLLFHVQEHTYNLLQIESMISEQNLHFVGLEWNQHNNLFIQRFSSQPDSRSLGKWHQLEIENPGIFSGMYHFWCERN